MVAFFFLRKFTPVKGQSGEREHTQTHILVYRVFREKVLSNGWVFRFEGDGYGYNSSVRVASTSSPHQEHPFDAAGFVAGVWS